MKLEDIKTDAEGLREIINFIDSKDNLCKAKGLSPEGLKQVFYMEKCSSDIYGPKILTRDSYVLTLNSTLDNIPSNILDVLLPLVRKGYETL